MDIVKGRPVVIVHTLPAPQATTTPDPGAIAAAARYFTSWGLGPEIASEVCPDPLAASALELAMTATLVRAVQEAAPVPRLFAEAARR